MKHWNQVDMPVSARWFGQIEIIACSRLGEDALESAQEYAKDSKKRATKKVKEAAE